MEYDRDLNACVNIAHRVMSSMGWGRCEPPKPADEGIGVKPTLKLEAPDFSRGVAHLGRGCRGNSPWKRS
jgi:hypothetical protein